MRPALTKNQATLRATITFLNSNGVTHHVDIPPENRKHSSWYNCWGFTKGILQTEDTFEWTELREMEDWLKDNTVEIKMHREPLKCGDIVVFRGVNEEECYCGVEEYDDDGEITNTPDCTCEPELLHTAILVDPDQMIIIHKPGGWPLERCTVERVGLEHPIYGEVTEYRRIKK